MTRRARPQQQMRRGFTLVEMVVAITIGGIVMGFMALFLTAPVTSYFAQTRRAQLVDGSEAITRHMTRDLKAALPTSVRQRANGANFRVIEMMTLQPTIDGVTGSVRYDPATLTPTSVSIRGQYIADAAPQQRFANRRIAIGGVGSNPYGPGVLSQQGDIFVTPSGIDQATLTFPASAFAAPSPTNRLFMTSATGTVAYLCDLAARTLTRYEGFPIVASINAHDTAAELAAVSSTSTLIARDVVACNFSPIPPTQFVRGLVSIHVTLDRNGELLQVFEQVPLEHGP